MLKRFRNFKDSWLLSVLVFAILSAPAALLAQQGQRVSGKVSDEQGPLAGVTVSVKHKSVAASTDTDGAFVLTGVRMGDTLLFHIVGYVDKELAGRNTSPLNVVLQPDNLGQEEVGVVAYCTQRKVSVTSAISTIDTKELKQRPTEKLAASLAGRMPGLTALQS